MRLRILPALVLAALLWLAGTLPAAALPSDASRLELVKVPTAWLPEQSTFPIWYAKQQGWDKAAGIDLQLFTFDSGADALRAFPSKGWVFGGLGAVPAMLGAVRYNMSIIGLGNDESQTNAVMVREDSPILKTQGFNKDFPDIYGDPASVRGKTILCTRATSAGYALELWLNALGLKDSDIVYKNLEQASALAAFDYNIGDAVVLWAPFTFVGEKHGWKTVATPKMLRKHLPIVLVANSAYAAQYPNITATFLDLYLRGVAWMRSAPRAEVVAEFQKFFLDWAGQNYSADMLELHAGVSEFFSLDQQLKLFNNEAGPSEVQQWLQDLAVFFSQAGLITGEELKKLQGSPYVNDKYLKRVARNTP